MAFMTNKLGLIGLYALSPLEHKCLYDNKSIKSINLPVSLKEK